MTELEKLISTLQPMPEQWDAAYAERVVVALRASKLPVTKFARAMAVHPSRILWWNRKIPRERRPARASFVPVTLPARDVHSASLELVFGDGTLLRFPASLAPEQLAGFAHALTTRTAS